MTDEERRLVDTADEDAKTLIILKQLVEAQEREAAWKSELKKTEQSMGVPGSLDRAAVADWMSSWRRMLKEPAPRPFLGRELKQ